MTKSEKELLLKAIESIEPTEEEVNEELGFIERKIDGKIAHKSFDLTPEPNKPVYGSVWINSIYDDEAKRNVGKDIHIRLNTCGRCNYVETDIFLTGDSPVDESKVMNVANALYDLLKEAKQYE